MFLLSAAAELAGWFSCSQERARVSEEVASEDCAIAELFLNSQNLVVLGKLHLVVVNRLSQVLRHRVPVFDVVQLLQAVDCNRKDLTRRLQNASTLPLKLLDVSLCHFAVRLLMPFPRAALIGFLLGQNFVFDKLGVDCGHLHQVLL